MARLILNPGKPDEQVYQLGTGAHTIGRTKGNDVFILHKSLSRHHARLTLAEGQDALIEDLGSKNGTFVDGMRIERRELRRAHYVKCGDLVFSFVPDGAHSEPPPAPGLLGGPSAPTLVYDLTNDPGRQSLGQLLAGRTALGTALNLRSASTTDRARDKLQILLKVSELLSSPAAIDEVLSRVLELAFEILDVHRGSVLLLEDGEPVPRVHRARPGVEEDRAFSSQIVRYVLAHGVAALFADAKSDPRIDAGASIMQQSICASMCAPLKARDKLLGAIYVDNLTRADRFNEEDLEFLSAFANQAAVAIDNAMLSSKLADEAVARNTLLRFFPPTAIDAIMKKGASLDAIQTEATALFCDISGYTELSARMTPHEVLALLNEYFPVMADIVFAHEGTLEKYIGDALLAVWGAPFARPDDPERAVRAAIDMQRAILPLNQRLSLPLPLAIHVGINSGVVAAGNIGSSRYLQYATIGDATNVASRVCGAAGAGEIVIDERTARRLGSDAPPLHALDPVPVKGKAEPLSLLRVAWS